MSKYKKVFVVDDDKIYHFILKNLLSKNKIDVQPSFYENGFDAMEAFKERIGQDEIPDLILLDINMPIMDGWQFLEEFRVLRQQHQLETAVYLVTSSNDSADLQKAKFFEDEIANYFLKPIDQAAINEIFQNQD
jgi:two-component system chemotaxis response regulator CheY